MIAKIITIFRRNQDKYEKTISQCDIRELLKKDIADELAYLIKLNLKTKESSNIETIADEVGKTKHILSCKRDVLDTINMFMK